MRTSIYAIIILLIASGCSVEKRLARLLEKHPQPPVIEYIPGDTIFLPDSIPVFIPGDTVIDSALIDVPVDIPDTSITIETPSATFTASIKDNTLYAEVNQPDSTYIVPVDSVIQIHTDTIRETIIVIKEVTVKPKIFPFILSAAIIEFLLLIILFFLLIKLKK